MSTVDERIVQMQFDNRQFESGIQTSIKSLDKLKSGLELDKAVGSLNNLDKVGKSFSLAGIATGVETISSRFSTLGIIGVTALQNITNSAINTGKRMLSALTIDPIKSGLTEYETKMNAITTILTNTQSKGTTLDDVNAALGELNTYADQTIYNFAEMTRNIGTFTAAGVDLDTATKSIKGIANLAAGSGSSAQQASTAMYQLSQAIAAGSLKLQDWNSVVNAGMGGELMQNALKETAKGMGIVVDESVPFRESLAEGWITADVLTKTLERFAEDDTLVKAATQVKTFTQLVDTMGESVQSGWAVSWEYIIGNREQAIEVLTAVSDGFNNIIGPSADARNEMLKFWNENGGRDAIISALSNAFQALVNVVTPIKEAFREIFPATTGQQLVDLSNKIKSLTENFKMGEETSTNLKNTFKGLFALLDIGKQAFMALATGVGSLLGNLLPAGDGILSFTGRIGEYIVSLNEALKTSGFFNVAIQKIGQVFSPIANGISAAVKAISDAFKSFATIDMSGVDAFADNINIRFSPISALCDLVKKAISGLLSGLEKLSPGFFTVASIIGEAFGKLGKAISNAFINADFDAIFDIVNSGLLAGILVGLKKFVGSLSNISDNAGGMLGGITGLLDGVKGSLEAYQSSLKAGTLIKIAAALGILAASLVALSLIDSEKLTLSLVAMSAMFAELFGSMAIFEKVMAGSGFRSMGKVTTAMIGLSVAVLLLSTALVKISEVDYDGLIKGLVGVAGLMAILVTTTKALSSSSGQMMKGSTGLITFALALNILVTAVEKLAVLDTNALIKGLVGVGVLAAELALFMNAAQFGKIGVSTGVGLIALSAAILILSESVEKFAQMDSNALIKGLVGVGAVLAELAIFVNLTGGASKVTSTAIGLTVLGAAMLIFGEAIDNMGSMSWDTIGKGLTTMAGALTIVAAAMTVMPKNMLAQSVSLVAISGALIVLGNALQSMGGMSWEEIAKGLITLAGALTIIATAVNLMSGALPGAAALLVISAALTVLAGVLKILGGMSLQEIGLSLLALVGVFTVLGGSALILAPLTPAILGLSAAIALLGVGVVAVGAGLLAFSAGLAALAVSGTAGAVALVAVITSIAGVIPALFTMLGEAIVAFAVVIGDSSVTLVEALGKLLVALLDKIIELTPKITEAATAMIVGFMQVIIDTSPKIIEAMGVLLTELLDHTVEYVPKLVDAGMKILSGFLKGIADNIADVVATAVTIIVNFITAIGTETPRIVDAGFKMIISFINGLADSIRTNTPIVNKAIANLISAMLGGFANTARSFKDIGVNIMKGLVEGVKSMATSVVNAAKDVVNGAIKGAKNLLGIHSPSRVFAEMGMYMDQGMANGLTKFAGLVSDASSDVGDTAIDSLSNTMSRISDVINSDVDTPTIRPILDLTDVESGASNINGLLASNNNIAVAGRVSSSMSARQNGSTDRSILDTLSKIVDKINTDGDRDSVTPPQITINVTSNSGNALDISRRIQKDLNSYYRSMGTV